MTLATCQRIVEGFKKTLADPHKSAHQKKNATKGLANMEANLRLNRVVPNSKPKASNSK